MGGGSSGTRPITHQNIEFSHTGIDLEFGTGVKIISYTSPFALPLCLSSPCFGNIDIVSAPLVILSRART